MLEMTYPPKPQPGDRVAVLSPASGLPEIFPLPFDLGLRRLREEFDLEPVEYSTTRKMNSSPQDRVADLHAAVADDSIKAIVTSIGGDDQIRLHRHLDLELLRANPKPFLGFSDNTNLLAALYSVGIVGYYGAAVMTDFGRGGAMHPLTMESTKAALLGSGEWRLRPSDSYSDVDVPWEVAENLKREPDAITAPGWTWRNADNVVTGNAWGGCLEVVSWMLAADKAIPSLDDLDGATLFLETSEEMPADLEVYRMLRNLGERGILSRCGALLMGRPKGWSFAHPNDSTQRATYVAAQHDAVLSAMTEYAPDATVVLGIDFGHTSPRVTIPYGGEVRVDGPAREITVRY